MFRFRRFKFDVQWFLMAFIFLCGFGAYINIVSPDSMVTVVGLLIILAGLIFSSSMFVIHSVKRSILYMVGIVTILILRYIGLREWYFPVLMAITVFSGDAYFSRSDSNTPTL